MFKLKFGLKIPYKNKMNKIPQHIIDQVRDTAEIYDIVSEYVDLKQRGNNFFGLCPFHNEKTPSFSISPEKEIFHCFGCGAGGNSITFLMDYEKISFIEALEKIADKYGISLNYEKNKTSLDFFTKLYEIHISAEQLFINNINNSSNKNIKEYFYNRGIQEKTITDFKIGFANDSWNDLFNHLKTKFSSDLINKSGLFINSKKGTFDRFRNRIIFPIRNKSNKIVGFGGRDISGNDPAKYLNSPETQIYNKSEILYGLPESKDLIRKEKTAFLVEGYMDLIQLHQNGIKNIVASSGTSLTIEQVSQLKKFVDNVFIVYDGDNAGRKASIAASYNLLRGGINPKIIEIPNQQDPDSFVKNNGINNLHELIKKPLDILTFQFKYSNYDLNNSSEKSNLTKEIINELIKIDDEIIQTDMIKKMAELIKIDEQFLLKRFNQVLINNSKIQTIKIKEKSNFNLKERELIRLLISGNKKVFMLIKKNFSANSFKNILLKKIGFYLYENEQIKKSSKLIDIFETKENKDTISELLFSFKDFTEEEDLETAVECIISIEKIEIKNKLETQRINLKEIEKQGFEKTETLSNILKLRKQLDELNLKQNKLLKEIK